MAYTDPNDNNKGKTREILAILLIGILAIYFFMNVPSNTQNQNHLPTQQAQALSNNATVLPVQKDSTNGLEKTAETPAALNKSIKEEIVSFDTDRYKLSFSSLYGTINNIVLKDYKTAKNDLFNITPVLDNYNALPLLYKLDGYSFENGYKVEKTANSIIFTQAQKDITLIKTYTFNPKNFDIKLSIQIKNNTSKDILTNSHLIWGKSLGPIVSPEEQIQYDKVVTPSYFDSSEIKLQELKEEKQAKIDYFSLDNRYFLMAIIPHAKSTFGDLSSTSNRSEGTYTQILQLAEGIHIPSKDNITKEYVVYLGPKNAKILKTYNIGLEQITQRGWFFFPLLGSFLIWILTGIKGLVGSYAIAIILFAILLRLVFHPLNLQSMIAMSRQADLQQKIQGIKEKFPEKQAQNIKIMELYRQEGINPYKGCLPLLIQIPFFISFYRELPGVIDLVHSHFLWIKDLSSPDTVMFINSFKHMSILPYRFNVLPILIALVTIIQTMITTKGQPSTSQTRMMMYFMPIMFLFILWNAPSGLNLYWLTQTIATIGAQWHFSKNKERILAKVKAKKKTQKVIRKK